MNIPARLMPHDAANENASHVLPYGSKNTGPSGPKNRFAGNLKQDRARFRKSNAYFEVKNMATERELTDAKLEAAEARTEQKFTELSGKIDRLSDLVTLSVSQTAKDMAALQSQIGEVKEDNKYTRWTIIVTVVVSLLAALAALFTTQGNLLSAFQAGLAGKAEIKPITQPKQE